MSNHDHILKSFHRLCYRPAISTLVVDDDAISSSDTASMQVGFILGYLEAGRRFAELHGVFYREDDESGGNHRCDICGHMWVDHLAPGIKCPK